MIICSSPRFIEVPQMASLFFLLISALYIFSSVSADDVNIDCGTSGSYIDDDNFVWTGDDDYIVNGEPHTVQNTNKFIPEINTLRAFTTRKKNCYSIPVGKGERVLVRATFFYGNYDKLSSPPTFDLHFNGNYWATVETSSTDYVYYETTYVLKADSVSVCVAQTRPGQFPFISALEVVSLPLTMYDNVALDYPLHLMTRNAFGSTTRYRDYTYNRIWTPVAGGGGLTAVTSDAFIVDTTNAKDAPPSAVLLNAVTATSPTAGITLLVGVFPSQPISICLNMYFSEVTQLDETQNRSFQIVMNKEPLLENAFVPSYANATEFSFNNLTVFENTTFALVPTADSTEPPLINAMELFQIGDALTDGTNSQDVDGLNSLREAFADQLQDWGGDPCLPAPYSWDWIECSNDSTPRVTALHLSSFGLTGALPDFSSMDALETIDFHNNSLDGSIPDFLSTLPNLKQLNLASNHFSGPIPDSLTKKKGLNLVVTENPDLCTSVKECETSSSSPTDTPGFSSSNPQLSGGGAKKKKSKLPVILGTTLPISIIAWAAIGVKVVLRHRKRAGAVAASSSGGNGPQSSPLNLQMMGKMGEAIVNEIKINMDQDQQSNVELPAHDQTYQQQDGTTTN